MTRTEIDAASALSLAERLCLDYPTDARLNELRDWVDSSQALVAEAGEFLEERDDLRNSFNATEAEVASLEAVIDRLEKDKTEMEEPGHAKALALGVIARAKELADFKIDQLRSLYPAATDTEAELLKICKLERLSRGALIEAILHEEFTDE